MAVAYGGYGETLACRTGKLGMEALLPFPQSSWVMTSREPELRHLKTSRVLVNRGHGPA